MRLEQQHQDADLELPPILQLSKPKFYVGLSNLLIIIFSIREDGL